MSEWTKRYYDEAYIRRWHLDLPNEKIQRDAVFLLKQLGIEKSNYLFDVGCGQGRYTLAFAKIGVKVIGLDASDFLLAEAKRLASQMGLSVKWLLADMRRIPFEDQFDGITSIDAFGFFEDDLDNQKAVMQMAKAMKPSARLVIVVANGVRILNNFQSFDREEREGLTVEIERELLSNRKAIREKLCLRDKSGESRYERYQRLYSVEELSELANNAGLMVRDVFGDFIGDQFNPNLSEKIILLAERGKNAGEGK